MPKFHIDIKANSYTLTYKKNWWVLEKYDNLFWKRRFMFFKKEKNITLPEAHSEYIKTQRTYVKFENGRKPIFTEKLGVDMSWKFKTTKFWIFMYAWKNNHLWIHSESGGSLGVISKCLLKQTLNWLLLSQDLHQFKTRLKVHYCRFENLLICSNLYKNNTLKIFHF